jgi:hypothetical protein
VWSSGGADGLDAAARQVPTRSVPFSGRIGRRSLLSGDY